MTSTDKASREKTVEILKKAAADRQGDQQQDQAEEVPQLLWCRWF
jgi:hypothetical protein